MQVWTKLALGFALTTVAIVGAYGASQLREEERDLRAAAERDLRLIGTALQVAIGHALEDQQAAAVRELIDAVKLRDPSLDVVVFDTTGLITAGSWGSTATDDLVRGFFAEAQSTARAVVGFEGPGGLSHLASISTDNHLPKPKRGFRARGHRVSATGLSDLPTVPGCDRS